MFCKLTVQCPYYDSCINTNMAEFCSYHRLNVEEVSSIPSEEETSLAAYGDTWLIENVPEPPKSIPKNPPLKPRKINKEDLFDPFDLSKNG